jgi:glycosyltransferase involved in cell wall biosynthesis
MKIASIAAGAAGMYCGSCLHDNTLAAALLDLGEDVVLIPTYTPLRTDEPDVSQARVFFGGINIYLQQKSFLFRHTPWWFDRLLDRPVLLKSLSRRASSVDPTRLGDLTVSMLRGEDGNQRKELEKLASWLFKEVRPNVIQLSNAVLLGMAPIFSGNLAVPVVCTLAGEDSFLERLAQPYYDQARQLLCDRAQNVNAFIAFNSYYADRMSAYLSVDRAKIHVIPHGLRLEGHGSRRTNSENRLRVIGFLARICEDKGLHHLVEACELLDQMSELPPFELKVAGYLGKAEQAYLQQVQDRVAEGTLAGRFTYLGELSRAQKIAMLQSLDIFCVPTLFPEAKGLSVMEAMANAVPVVLPDLGSFSELVQDTGGGLLYEPHNAVDLAAKLGELLVDMERADQIGQAGQRAICDRYHAERMAQQTRDLYRRLIG